MKYLEKLKVYLDKVLRDIHFERHYYRLKEFSYSNKKLSYGVLGIALLSIFYTGIKLSDSLTETTIYNSDKDVSFKKTRVLSNPNYKINNNQTSYRKVRELQESQLKLEQTISMLQKSIEAISNDSDKEVDNSIAQKETVILDKKENTPQAGGNSGTNQVRLYKGQEMRTQSISSSMSAPKRIRKRRSSRRIINFPVKREKKKEVTILPAGSYVKAKALTGVRAPEGKAYPVLLQIDYSYILPSYRQMNMVGCFMIAKATGSMSTEAVELQAEKISCISKTGDFFEQDVNGFMTDPKDNILGIKGKVVSKQDRVAAMAFMSSVVAGVGNAIQQAQTTQQTTPLGGSQSTVTGDQGKYIAAGGVSNAASMVTQWYLKQAQSLLPYIEIDSGLDIWIVMLESVKVPNKFFQEETKGIENEKTNKENIYSSLIN